MLRRDEAGDHQEIEAGAAHRSLSRVLGMVRADSAVFGADSDRYTSRFALGFGEPTFGLDP